ncbi:MAG: TIGR01212 family radical SAM protein [Calditrichaeota bacterium]|nr:TIGR01212 family radical SAM protein [Calditrichota bacterium]MCB0301934.1 TIGR01212 family radical SAM protein [Calditrichota bacterium]
MKKNIKKRNNYPWGTSRPYNAYKNFLANKFGSRLQKVSVDAGFTCPNRDGAKAFGGCTYCNNMSFVPYYCTPGMSIEEQTRAGIEYLQKRYGEMKFVVYFQAYSNTYAPLSYLKHLYEQALRQPEVCGLVVSTRPDCIDEEKIAYFETLAKSHYVSLEYGLESIYDATLERLNRGHGFAEWADAVNMTANRGIHVAAHLILGLPGETREQMLKTAEVISQYPIQSLKLHHLHIVKKTALATEYLREPFPLFEYEEYIDLAIEFLRRLNPEIMLQRLVGETRPKHLIAPHWGVRTSVVVQDIEAEMQRRGVCQGDLYQPENGAQLAKGLSQTIENH